MSKDNNGFIKGLDPAVEAMLRGGAQRKEERSLPKVERAKVKKNRTRQEERNGRRAVYDLDPELISKVQELAREHGTTASQVAGILLHVALGMVETGRMDLGVYKRALPRNPRYEYELVWSEEK